MLFPDLIAAKSSDLAKQYRSGRQLKMECREAMFWRLFCSSRSSAKRLYSSRQILSLKRFLCAILRTSWNIFNHFEFEASIQHEAANSSPPPRFFFHPPHLKSFPSRKVITRIIALRLMRAYQLASSAWLLLQADWSVLKVGHRVGGRESQERPRTMRMYVYLRPWVSALSLSNGTLRWSRP